MAADPQLVSAFNKIVIMVAPIFIIAAILNAFAGGARKKGKYKRKKDDGLLNSMASDVDEIFHQRAQRSFFKKQNTLEQLRSLPPNVFEEYIVNLFQKLGYKAERVGGAYDGGIDVILTKNGAQHFVQCKKYINRQVSVNNVRDFYGAIASKLSLAKAFFITTNVFTLEAEKFCEDKPIELVDGKRLMDYVHQAGAPLLPETVIEKCPLDGGELVQKNGRYGPFIGCRNYPNCKFTKSLS